MRETPAVFCADTSSSGPKPSDNDAREEEECDEESSLLNAKKTSSVTATSRRLRRAVKPTPATAAALVIRVAPVARIFTRTRRSTVLHSRSAIGEWLLARFSTV